MYYEAELSFLRRLLENFHLNTSIITSFSKYIPAFDQGLRKLIYNNEIYNSFVLENPYFESPRIIFRIQDEFMCNYIYFQLPDTEPEHSHLLIGPYTNREISKEALLNLMEKLSLPPQFFAQLKKYYASLPFLVDEGFLFSIVSTFGEKIWGSLENFSVEYIDNHLPDSVEPVASRPDFHEPEEAFLSMQILEERYATENQLIHAVSQGLVHKAELAFSSNSFQLLEQRLADPVRDIKNYCIILNTLLRKGAEQGSVHPLHIDSLSSRYARKIEQLTSTESIAALQKEMIHKYCLLVKNHSMKGFSLPVQKVLTRIDSDLTADLSLKTQAKLLNVNASYLSTLFKKETGVTLTDYVNRKRVEYAIFLLNSTSMQIQNIAQYCGIPDVNYFTKIFKKYIGKTPKEYREEIS